MVDTSHKNESIKDKIKIISRKDTDVEIKYIHSVFPAKEMYVKIPEQEYEKLTNTIIISIYSGDSDTIITVMMLADSLRRLKSDACIIANFEYFPYGRQDRVCEKGESFSLEVFIDILKLKFDKIYAIDVHSKVTKEMITDVDENQYNMDFKSIKTGLSNKIGSFLNNVDLILAPDKGAVIRANILAKQLNINIMNLDKKRENDKIISSFNGDINVLKKAKSIVIPDDICDGGGTFLGAIDVIRKYNTDASVFLVISHGIFSKGTEIILERYNDILVLDNHFNSFIK